MKKIFKSVTFMALYALLFGVLVHSNVNAMQPRLQCKTCCNGEAPDKPTPENKDNGSTPAPSTPRPSK